MNFILDTERYLERFNSALIEHAMHLKQVDKKNFKNLQIAMVSVQGHLTNVSVTPLIVTLKVDGPSKWIYRKNADW